MGDEHNPPVLAGLDHLDLKILLNEVVERVHVLASLGEGLQSLLEGVVSVASDLDLDAVLNRVVQTATAITNAQYAALGVLDPSDKSQLSQFVTVGIDESTSSAIGRLPQGRGVLGLLIDEPQPLRLEDLSTHPSSVGFPPHHPSMRSFLGVPIKVGGEVYGNLYLTEKRGEDAFTAADEQMVLALAAAAGLAVRNARLYQDAWRRQQWLQASTEVATSLLEGVDSQDVLGLITAKARRLAGADVAFLTRPAGEGELAVEVADGRNAAKLLGQRLPQRSMSAQVMHLGRPLAVTDARADSRVWQGVIEAADAGPALFVPLGSKHTALGTLVVANTAGGRTFTAEDVRLMESFAAQAALSLRLGSAARDREMLAVLGDRDRIARDLHDNVIQRLFATGMTLQSALRRMSPEQSSMKVSSAIEELDRTIKDIRTTIFGLHHADGQDADGVRSSVLRTLSQFGGPLGFQPTVVFEGAVDTLVSSDVAEHLIAVLREALSNTARHAGATQVEVHLAATPEHVLLRVTVNGRGIPPLGRRSGLRNMAERAAVLGGSFHTACPDPESGTVLEWTAPLLPQTSQ